MLVYLVIQKGAFMYSVVINTIRLTDQDCTTPPLNLATLRVVVVAVQLLIDHGAAAAGTTNAAHADKNAGMQLSAINGQTRTKATHKADAHISGRRN